MAGISIHRAVVAVLWFVCATSLSAQEPTWQERAKAIGLTPGEIAHLDRHSLLIGRDRLSHPTDVYLNRDLPYFVSSDVVLFTYARLLESSMRMWESALLLQLRRGVSASRIALEATRGSWDSPDLNHDADRKLRREGWLRSWRILAVAELLVGQEFEMPKEEAERLAPLIAEIQRAEGQAQPDWLGPYDDGFMCIDLDRFKPVSFYAEDEELSGYFRAVRWLQMVPFRLRREDELAASWALNNAEAWLNRGLWRRYEFLVGSSDAWNPDLLAPLRHAKSFQEFRSAITAAQTGWTKKLQLDLVHGPSATLESEASFRLLPSAPSLHGLLNQAIEGSRDEKEQPTGLELGVLLGSKLACELLGTERSERIKAQAPLLQESQGLIGQSLLDLQLLLDAPEANAPPLFASDAWQRKSLATALGGWAQLQSVVVGHQLGAMGRGGSTDHPGFIEPEPRYFAAIAKHCAFLGRSSGFFQIRGEEAAEMTSPFQELSYLCTRLEGLAYKQLQGASFSDLDGSFLFDLGLRLHNLSSRHASDIDCRATEMHHDPVRQRSCIVGTGPARPLYVLYPWQGERILCRGSALPYHEHFAPAPMTNEEWDAALGGADPIPLPSWQVPLYASDR